jgi:hypothetical protein
MTQWGKEVSPDKPVLPEYPRMQMVRKEWLNLNGWWEYAITPKMSDAPAKYDGKILVPYPIESVLSQVSKAVTPADRLWYSRTFEIPKAWEGKRVLLNFGAVDWDTTVTLNGKSIGNHTGGYDGFSFDITDALKPSGPQELVVSVWDPIIGGQPHGKQDTHPGGITYTPTVGIWETVWLEPVAPTHIDSLKMISDIDRGQMRRFAASLASASSATRLGTSLAAKKRTFLASKRAKAVAMFGLGRQSALTRSLFLAGSSGTVMAMRPTTSCMISLAAPLIVSR